MHHTIFTKRILLMALAIFLAPMSDVRAEDSKESAFTFATFWGDLNRTIGRDQAKQISELKKIGFGGIAGGMWRQPGLDQLGRYQEIIGDDDSFPIYAGRSTVNFDKKLAPQIAHLDKVIKALAKSNSKLWLILGGKESKNVKVKHEEFVNFLRLVANKGKAAGVEVVLYPEWVTPGKFSLIKSAEEALPYIKEVGSDNLFVSLHLCHELKAGNGDRLDEVAAKIKPWLRLATINGADADAADELDSWTRTIQPLGMGTYDSSKLLKALKFIGYEGPVILHTGGGLGGRAPADHHQTAFKRFQEMVDALDED